MDQKRFVLSGGDIVFPDGIMRNGVVVIEGTIISGLAHTREFSAASSDRVIDCSGCFVCPGFIDLHNQGGNGYEVMDGSPENIDGMCRAHAAHGTTGLLLTPEILSDGYRTLLPALADRVGTDTGGADILGIHAEGPFTNPLRKGFMPDRAIMPPDERTLHDILDHGRGKIVEMTIAPELTGALDLIHILTRERIVASLGHSNAVLTDVLKAIDHGASHVTHFFNAMSPLHQREPGLVGAALYSQDLTVEIVADGFHVHPWVMELTIQNKGIDKTCLVTDSMRVTGFEDGEYEAMGSRVVLRGGRLSMADSPGTLAGSALTLDKAVGNIVTMLGLTISDAVHMASATPAAVIGLADTKGRIEIGYDADIAVLDRTYRARTTIVRGKVVYERQ